MMDVPAALAMGGAGRGETLMVLAKWVQDRGAQHQLFYVVYDKVVKLAVAEKWRVPKGGEYLRLLTRLAIAEVTDPKCCPTCGGRGATVRVVCPTCDDRGRRNWSDAMRARAAGIDKSNWSRTWGRRYLKVMGVVAGFEARGLASLRVGLE